MPGVIAAATVVMILSLGFYGIPALLGGGRTVMIAEDVSVQIFQLARWGVPAMLSTVLLAGVALTLLAASRIVGFRTLLLGGQ